MKFLTEAMFKQLKTYFLTVLFIILLASCGSEDPQNARLQVVLVDAPAEYQAVNVDVQEVHVRFNGAAGNQNESEDETESVNVESGWTDISDFEPQVVNLLDLVNGEHQVLADQEVPAGKLGEVRLVLGADNTLVIDGETSDLTIPSGSESGLKIKLNQELLAGVTYKLILDFDAARSVFATGSGKYNLKPVIHAEMEAQTGAIFGTVEPAEEGIVVYAIQATDSVSSYTDAQGAFLLQALEAGSYDVAAVSITDTVKVEGIEVVVGAQSDAGTLTFE